MVAPALKYESNWTESYIFVNHLSKPFIWESLRNLIFSRPIDHSWKLQKAALNSLPRSFDCFRTESADFCSLNGRTISTDCRSGVDSRGGAGVCLDVIKLEIVEWIRCSGYANCRNKVLRRIHSSWNNDQLDESLKARSSMVMIKDFF